MADVEVALGTVASIGSRATRVLQSLATKHDLLIRLLDDEHMRLHVWLTPLENEPRRLFSSSHSHGSIAEVSYQTIEFFTNSLLSFPVIFLSDAKDSMGRKPWSCHSVVKPVQVS